MTLDPFDTMRHDLQVPDPTVAQAERQRARLEAAMTRRPHAPSRARRRPRLRRLVPASGFAVAALALAAFVVVALQPGSSKRDQGGDEPAGLRLATPVPGGAFSGLDLETASAAEVLRAAGRAAADGVPEAGPDDWTFVRMESASPELPTRYEERWTSPDGERSMTISTITITDPDHGRVGTNYWLHYEHLKAEILGDVQWNGMPDGTWDRRAHWADDAGDGGGEIARMVLLTELLRDARSADEVGRALERSVEGADLRFQNGFACGAQACGGSGFLPNAQGLNEEESKRLYLTGQLLTVMLGTVFPPDATRAIYDYLAALPEASVAPAADGSGDVILSLRVKGPRMRTRRVESEQNGVHYESRPVPGSRYNTKAVAAIDPDTGRLVELNPQPGLTDMSHRYRDFGVAPGPGVGSSICEKFAAPCEEARDFERRREADPDAQFEGVLDWMSITRTCYERMDRGGAAPPSHLSNDPQVVAEREACERREADKARAKD